MNNNPIKEAARVNKGFEVGHCEHTAGPWKVDDSHPTKACYYINDNKTFEVATVYCYGEYRSKQLADARLIAAAPDLLAVARAVIEWWEPYDGTPHTELPMVRLARAAIAKAEGGSNA